MGELEGKVAVITGASRGIGKQVAIDLAVDGATVVLASRSDRPRRLPGTLGETVAAVEAAGGRAIAIKTDLAEPDEVDRLAAQTLAELGRVDILINNAAYTG